MFLEYIFTIIIIDTHGGRDVVIFGVPGEYHNADMTKEKSIILKIEGGFLDIMCEVNSEYKNNVHMENGVRVLYLRLFKFMYVCM